MVATGYSILLKNKSRSKESRVRAIENNQYVNGSMNTAAGADCRLIIRFVILFLNHICRSLYTVYLYVSYRDRVTEPISKPVYY